MKKWFYIEYWDKYGNRKHTTIKAKSASNAETIFYKHDEYSLVVKVSQIN